ncbi:EpsG family protein [Fusobacterium mortiferum]|uniref:EpsG family protein n=1 Tax=Fusobacterium mortiferum TaxID=850 RepID=UPI00356A4727
MIILGYLLQFILIIILQLKNSKRLRYLPFLIGTIFSLLLLTFNKGAIVGTDYRMYNNFFNYYVSRDFPSFFIKDSGWGLMVYFYIVGKVFQNFKITVAIMIIFYNYFIYYFFKKYAYNELFYFSFLTYFSFFYVENIFNPMKQIFAICIFSLGYIWIIKRKKIKYLITIIVATLFHTLSLTLIPCYYLFRNKIREKYILFIFLINLFLIIILKNNILLIGQFFSDNMRYYQYFLGAFNHVKFNIVNFFEVIVPFFLLLYLDYKYKLRKENKKNSFFINLYYTYSFYYLITILDKIMGVRFTLFFSLGFSISYPYIFLKIFRNFRFEKYFYLFYSIWLLIFLIFRHIRIVW